jgi:FkbM family methyltransferase
MQAATEPIQSYSQWGEDRLVWDFFGRSAHGFFVEVGANDPIAGSQTYLLEQMGWEGLLVEPQPECCERLRAQRPRSKVIQAACGSPAQRGKAPFFIASADMLSSLRKPTHERSIRFTTVAEVQIVTLDDVLEQNGSPKVDFLSIDVEECELDVLKGVDLARHRPRLILVEDYVFSLDVHRHLTRAGYRLVKRTGSNNWYVPRGTPFTLSSWWERVKLFRKMHLGTPVRRLKLRLRGEKPPNG